MKDSPIAVCSDCRHSPFVCPQCFVLINLFDENHGDPHICRPELARREAAAQSRCPRCNQLISR
jgi:hypothetical protein